MEEEFRFDPIDILRFMPVALRQASRKGFLNEIKKGNEIERKYFVLCGNLLYCFTKENDPSTLSGIMFLESSVLKIVSNLGTLALSVSAVGGKSLLLSTTNQTELVEWMEAIENSKFISLSRKLEDVETRSIQLNHQVEQHETVSQEYEKALVDMKEEIRALEQKNKQLEETINNLNAESREVKSQLRSSEMERSLLLKSRGITPKEIPLWALSEQPRGGVADTPEKIRIWTGSWNLGSSEPFAGMDKNRAQRLLQPLVPPGYDLYVLGVQECISDSVFDSLNGLLEAEGCRRLRLDNFSAPTGTTTGIGRPSTTAASPTGGLAAPIPSCTGIGMGNGAQVVSGDLSKLVGPGDGSLMSMKYTGLAIYAHVDILADVRLLAVTNIPFSTTSSRGGVAVALSIMGRTVVFVCCQLDLKSCDARRDQYQSLLTGLGSQLAEQGFHLNEQFHHIIWCGDFSYTLVDTSGNRMPPETVVKMLQDGRLFRTLFESHDQLNQEKKDKAVFFGYREAAPFPNFYPTYKKVENRNPVDYTNPAWVTNSYRTAQKTPFYKGGKTKEYTPAFADRILYHSMVDLAEDLIPECFPVEMNVYKVTGSESPSTSSSRSSGHSSRKSNASEMGMGRGSGTSQLPVVSIVGAGPPIPKTIAVVVDNYRSVNEGEGLNVSDHSPVFGTFILRLRHNFEKILSDSVTNKSTGSIGTVLNALSQGEKQLPPPLQLPGDAMLTSLRGSKRGGGDSTSKRSDLSSALQGEAPTTSTAFTASSMPMKIPKYSLLPPGSYRVRVSNIKLIWGMNEESPSSVSLLFPAPYESVAGERFADFTSDTEVAVAVNTTEDAFSLTSLSTSINKDTFSSPARTGGRPVSTPLMAQTAPSDRGSPRGMKSPSGEFAGAPKMAFEVWERSATSRTGTSLSLSTGAYYRQQNRPINTERSGSGSGAGLSRSSSSSALGNQAHTTTKSIAPLVLTWRGAEPLDKLHLSMRFCIPAFSFGAQSSTPGRISSREDNAGNTGDFLTGHCAVGLEQLCKVAMVSSGGASGCVTVTRILANQGRPMYNIDSRTLQREMVTMCCTLELLSNVE